MPSYEIEVRGLGGIGNFSDYGSVEASKFRVSWVLNGAGALEAEFNRKTLGDINNLDVGKRQLILRRDDVPIWGGYLSRIDVSRDDDSVKLIGEGYWAAARRRVLRSLMEFPASTNWYFSANTSGVIDPAKSIAWAMISAEQNQTNGSLGWVAGTHTGAETLTARTFSYKALDSIGTIIERLAEEGLGDFAVRVKSSPTFGSVATFDTWASRGTDKTASVQFSASNLMTLDYSISSEDLYTMVDVFSSVDDTFHVIRTSTSKVGDYGRRDGPSITVDAPNLGALYDAAGEYLLAHQMPGTSVEITFMEQPTGVAQYGVFDIGDSVRVIANDQFLGTFDGRIIEWNLAVEAGQTVHALSLEEVR